MLVNNLSSLEAKMHSAPPATPPPQSDARVRMAMLEQNISKLEKETAIDAKVTALDSKLDKLERMLSGATPAAGARTPGRERGASEPPDQVMMRRVQSFPVKQVDPAFVSPSCRGGSMSAIPEEPQTAPTKPPGKGKIKFADGSPENPNGNSPPLPPPDLFRRIQSFPAVQRVPDGMPLHKALQDGDEELALQLIESGTRAGTRSQCHSQFQGGRARG